MSNHRKDENWFDIDKQDSLEELNNDNGKNDFVIVKYLNVVFMQAHL
ncbi:hypothetical protein [Anaerobranca gottschalkii]|uniref:Uncharacterized protein n=1 Tax=Anaerobranca gottschalkii DSM 13577 TaxID=1120990 RepID=A0A1I0B1S4_9FIRM|nr:hypothetical protein [Anaerobranca gottschalkii]SET00687.1 hypothetical protein SAMN03080614_103020 [Anaerobranca gottschalkii DSM 13577]